MNKIIFYEAHKTDENSQYTKMFGCFNSEKLANEILKMESVKMIDREIKKKEIDIISDKENYLKLKKRWNNERYNNIS